MKKGKRKTRRIKVATLIVVGEGPHDKAFLNHMKNLYDDRGTGQKVKIDSGDGGSPADVIKTMIRKYRHTDFDKRFVLLDSDVTIHQQDYDHARKKRITVLTSEPICLEGMLLTVLGRTAPDSNPGCKSMLHPLLSGKPTAPGSYLPRFDKHVLGATDRETICILRITIANGK